MFVYDDVDSEAKYLIVLQDWPERSLQEPPDLNKIARTTLGIEPALLTSALKKDLRSVPFALKRKAMTPDERAKNPGPDLIPEDWFWKYGLRNGDLIRLAPAKTNHGVVVPTHVNFIPVAEATRLQNRLDLIALADKPVIGFPSKVIPVAKLHRSLTLKVLAALAPVMEGANHMLVAPPGAGKSWACRELAVALAVLTTQDPLFVLVVYVVGERPGDAKDLADALQLAVQKYGADPKRLLFFMAPDGVPSEIQWHAACTLAALSGQIAAVGGHTFILMDSMSRLLDAHAKAIDVSHAAHLGASSMGLPADSVGELVKNLMTPTGVLPNGGWRGVVPTMLKGDESKAKAQKKAEEQLWEQTGPSKETATWGFRVPVPYDIDLMPYVDMAITRTRHVELADPITLKQHNELRALMKRAGAGDAGFERQIREMLNWGRMRLDDD